MPPDDCEPNNPSIPSLNEINNNGLDDDCDPATPDVLPSCMDDQFDETASNVNALFATPVEDGNTTGVQYGGLVLCPETKIGTAFLWQRVTDLRSTSSSSTMMPI